MSQFYEECGSKYCNKCNYNSPFAKNHNGDEFCTQCAHISCWRCGNSNGNVEYRYYDEVPTYEWLCSHCWHTNWCQTCDREEGTYHIEPYEWYCFECLVKKEFEQKKCHCGADGRFYDKKTNKWYCSTCVSSLP